MKGHLLVGALALLVVTTLHAQDEHHGPVVYPASASTAPSAGQDGLVADTNMNPAPAPPESTGDNPAAPSADAATQPDSPSATAPGNPAINALPSLGAAANGNGKPDDIVDIRPPFFYLMPLTWLWVLLGVLVLAALAVALWFWLKPLRQRRAQTAYELALEKLERARALLNEENAEPYAVLVSETVRTYLGQRFNAPSTRRTTEEFLRQMQVDTNTPLAAHSDLLRGFLEACDLVKFAHYQPAREELEQVQQRAVSFVTATRPLEGAPA